MYYVWQDKKFASLLKIVAEMFGRYCKWVYLCCVIKGKGNEALKQVTKFIGICGNKQMVMCLSLSANFLTFNTLTMFNVFKWLAPDGAACYLVAIHIDFPAKKVFSGTDHECYQYVFG